MIVKKTKGKGFYGLLHYLLSDKKDGVEHRSDIIGGNLVGTSPKELSKEFKSIYQFKPTSKKYRTVKNKKTGEKEKREIEFKPVRHFSLNPHNDDRVSDAMWNTIADEFLTQFGYNKSPHIVVKHKDEEIKDKTHIHIATSNYNFNGKLVDEHNDVYKVKEFCREIEKKYGLKIYGEEVHNTIEAATEADPEKQEEFYERRRKLKQYLPYPAYVFAQTYRVDNPEVSYFKYYENTNYTVIRFKNSDQIIDKGWTMEAKAPQPGQETGPVEQDTVATMAQMAKHKGMQAVTVDGTNEFILAAWEQLEQAGVEIEIKDKQKALYKEYKELQQIDMLEEKLLEKNNISNIYKLGS